jgi:hypothetical protein
MTHNRHPEDFARLAAQDSADLWRPVGFSVFLLESLESSPESLHFLVAASAAILRRPTHQGFTPTLLSIA